MADTSPAPSVLDDDVDVPVADPAARVDELDDPGLPDPSGYDPAAAAPVKAHAGLKDDDDG